MPAYIFENEHDYLEVGYAADQDEAEHQWCEPKRAEWADGFEEAGGPTPEQWMAAGYLHSCAYCEHLLSASEGYCDRCADKFDDEEEKLFEENELGGIVFDGDMVFCSSYCHENDTLERQHRADAKAKAVAAFLAKCPYATVTDTWTGGTCKCECSRTTRFNACLHWTVPGATTGNYANSYCGGCGAVWVCNGDREAFERARDQYKGSEK